MSPASTALALLAAALMGAALQRGATCLVVAVDEVMQRRRLSRLLAIVAAAGCVSASLLLLRDLGVPAMPPAGRALGIAVLAGSVAMGLGAVVNGACAFGTVARLGSGEWAYAATPVGFFAGCTLVRALGWHAAMPVDAAAPLFALPAGSGWVAAGLATAGCAALLLRRRFDGLAATVAIGWTFAVLLVAGGAWAYTDLLAELAQGMQAGVGWRIALAAALLAGSLLAGCRAWRAQWPPRRQWLRCGGGGALMGLGGSLVPGGNDGLLLLAMPLGWPYAWAAFVAMVAAIAAGLAGRRTVKAARVSP